jgi:hypothetical protein
MHTAGNLPSIPGFAPPVAKILTLLSNQGKLSGGK